MTRRAVLVANLKSGRARAFPFALEALRQAGIQVESAVLSVDPAALTSVIAQSKEKSIPLLVVFGGDGTVGAVANAMARSGLTLGVVAGGTSNNFVRSLGIRPTVSGSVAAIANGRETVLALGQINDRYFAHAAIMGLNVNFARLSQRYRRVSGRLSYPLASLLVYGSKRRLELEIAGPGLSRSISTYQLSLMRPPPGASELQAATVDDLRFRTVVKGLPRIFFERHLGLPGGSLFPLSEATITASQPVDITLDGEIRATTPASVRVVPNALRVITPAAGWRTRPPAADSVGSESGHTQATSPE